MANDQVRLQVEKGKAADSSLVVTPVEADYVMVLDQSDDVEKPKVVTYGTVTGSALATEGGAGIAGIAETLETAARKEGDTYYTKILIDLTGLNCGGTAGDVIGDDGTGAAYLCQITAAESGTIQGGRMICLEAPTGGDADIDLYSATEATGVEDTAISALDETLLCNSGTNAVGTTTYFAAAPAADQYLYLVGQGTGDATYTAGKFLIEMWGV